MAMNKREKEYLEWLEKEVSIAKALRFTDGCSRDLPPPESSSHALSNGWDFNSYSKHVFKACSSSIGHGQGWDKTTSQNPRHLFSTKKKALIAMRKELEMKYAFDLAEIDKQIEEEND